MYPMPTLVSLSDSEADSDDDSDHGSDADTDPGDIESDTDVLPEDTDIPMPPCHETSYTKLHNIGTLPC